MSLAFAVFEEKSRLKSLLDHFSIIDDPREPWRVAHPLREVLLLIVCGSMADCDHYEAIAAFWRGEPSLPAPLLALRVRRARRTLAHLAHEPHQSGAVFGGFHRLGAGGLAGSSRSHRHRRENLASQP